MDVISGNTCAAAEITYLNSCQSRFSGVYLVVEVFQDTWRSNEENPSAYWRETLSCPLMASNYKICISFRSRSGLVPDTDHPLDFLSYLVLQACISFVVFQTKEAPLCCCLVRIKMPLLTCSW